MGVWAELDLYGTPLKTNMKFLLEWCCANSRDFANDFVRHFESIFAQPMNKPEVRAVRFPIFLKTVLTQGDITPIERLVTKATEDPRDERISATLFEAMSNLGDSDLRKL
jgi:hypothetical protein